MVPSPPIWIITRIRICPKSDQWLKVSTNTNPVTQEALVAVNSAVIKSVHCPSLEETGNVRRQAPIRIIAIKFNAIVLVLFTP